MRLIDADTLESYGLSRFFDDYAFDVIDKMPTIDAVQVVRCRECRSGEKRKTANFNPFWYCTRQGCSIKADDYCSYGERRER